MYSQLLKKLTKEGLKHGEKIGKTDPANPLTIDGVQFVVDVGKQVIEWIF